MDFDFDRQFAPIGGAFRSAKHELDGYVRASVQHQGNGQFNAYSLLSRFGWIESVFGLLTDQAGKRFPAAGVSRILELMQRSLYVLRRKGLQPPWTFCFSIVNAEGMTMLSPDNMFFDGRDDPIRRRELIFPPFTLWHTPTAAEFNDSLKPLFDMIWNAFGAPEIPLALLRA